MSTTKKVLGKLYEVTQERAEGITVTDFWDYLLSDSELAKELVVAGERRVGVVTGLQTRIRKNGSATEGLRILKNAEGKNVFVLDMNNISRATSITENYLAEISGFKFETENFELTKAERAVVSSFEKNIGALQIEYAKLKKLSNKLETKKMELVSLAEKSNIESQNNTEK